MNYIEELRKLVGKRPLIMVGAGVLVWDASNRLLMIKRTDNGCWGIPGGGMELGESLEETARRETREETGLEIGSMSLFGVFSGPEFYYEYPNGDQAHIVSMVYLTRDVRGEIRLSSEHSESGFFDLQNLPAELSPPVRPILLRATPPRPRSTP